MPDDLDRLRAQRDKLYAEIERLELAEAGTEPLQPARARLAEVLHAINAASDGIPDL